MIAFIGIDVSKKTLDVVFFIGNRMVCFQVKNTLCGLREMLARVRKTLKGHELHWCMEATGPYSFLPAMFLVQEGQRVSVVNPRRVKHYGLAIGALHKTDRADAQVIARYAEALKPDPWHLAEPHMAEFTFLTRRLADLNKLRGQESNRLEHPGLPSLVKEGILASLKEFDRQVTAVEARIGQIIKLDPHLSESVELLTTIPGIAWRAATVLLAEAGPISECENAQDLAAIFGLQPKLKRSGTSVHGKTQISKAGNAHGRRTWYMPAVVAIRVNPILRDFYARLVANHKPKKSALIAVERKLMCIAYGVLKHKKPFDPNYLVLTD